MKQALIDRYRKEISELHAQLGIPDSYRAECSLPLCHPPEDLVETELDYYGRPQRLTPAAYESWRAMKAAATSDGVVVHLISAFRDPDYQYQLIKRKLEQGHDLDDILRVNAAPGFSEHHTGRAIDIGTDNCPALVTEFEETPAFQWLIKNAQRFNFVMSYPRDNPLGIVYEPWHWCFLP